MARKMASLPPRPVDHPETIARNRVRQERLMKSAGYRAVSLILFMADRLSTLIDEFVEEHTDCTCRLCCHLDRDSFRPDEMADLKALSRVCGALTASLVGCLPRPA